MVLSIYKLCQLSKARLAKQADHWLFYTYTLGGILIGHDKNSTK